MATVKFIPGKKMQTRSSLSFILSYCKRDAKTIHDGRKLVSGINCIPESAYHEFMNTKMRYGKTDGRMFYHLFQSFHPDEQLTPETAHEIALKLAEHFKGYEVLVATHIDRNHIHSHFVINSVNTETGYKYHPDKGEIQRLRDESDRQCREYGLSVIEPELKKTQQMSAREYRSADKGQSWKIQLAIAIDDAMCYAKSKQDFIELMVNEGYEVKWTDERRFITYTAPNGMKCRDNKLHEEKYLKENMEIEFRIRNEIATGIEGTGTAANENGGKSRAMFYSHGEQLESYDCGTANPDRYAQEDFGRTPTVSDGGRFGQSHERSDCTVGTIHRGFGGRNRGFSESDEECINRNSESHEKIRGGIYTTDEYGCKRFIITGWEDERAIFAEYFFGEGTDEVVYEEASLDCDDTFGTPDYIGDYTANLVADFTNILDEDRPIEDCTTIHYPSEKKKHQQSGGFSMGSM